jgi:nucleoside-diphosphate-sugar epimerase
MKNAIVTGATGFVGVHLVTDLLSRGVRVTALCRENSPNLERLPSEAEKVYCLDKLPKADVFYHLAWEGASGPGRGDAALQARNAELTLRALMTAHQINCGKFVALGTVYENLAPQIKESGKAGAPDFYILSKEYAHSVANQLAYKLGMEFIWCKICHPIGRFIKPEQLMAVVVSGLLGGVTPAFGSAATVFDIVAVEDIARGLRLLGGCGPLPGREYYIGSGAPKSLRDWLEETRRILGSDVLIGFGERPDDGLRFNESWFDIAPLAEATGYAPRVGFADAVKTVKEWIANIG